MKSKIIKQTYIMHNELKFVHKLFSIHHLELVIYSFISNIYINHQFYFKIKQIKLLKMYIRKMYSILNNTI